VDYVLMAADNINAGTGMLTLNGIGNCKGTVTKEFRINPKPIDGAEIIAMDTVYTGLEVFSEVQIVMDGKTLVEKEDYTLSFDNNVNAGTATVTAAGTGNYTGIAEGTFAILPASLEEAQITLGSINTIYDGEEKRPNVLVRLNKKRLTTDTDYTVSFIDNIGAGEAQVVVSGTGNYTGTASKIFVILPQIFTDIEISQTEALAYYGKPYLLNLVAVKNGIELVQGQDYEVEGGEITDDGKAAFDIIGIGNYSGTATAICDLIDADTLATFTLPASLKTIEEEAFAEITARRISVPEGCREIGSRAFADCEELIMIELPSSLEIIAADAFANSQNLVYVSVPENAVITEAAFENSEKIRVIYR